MAVGYYLVIGFALFGWLLPDLAVALGGSDRNFTIWSNLLCSVAFGLIAWYLAFS